MGNWKSNCWGDSEEPNNEMRMDGSEPVNLKDKKSRAKKGQANVYKDEDVSSSIFD